MLHDVIHLLEPEQRFRHAMLLAHFACINGAVTKEELSFFEQRLGASMLSPERRRQLRDYLVNPPNLEDCLDGLSQQAGKLALRDACLMSLADREIDAKEKAMLERLAEEVGVEEELIDDIVKWVVQGYHWIQGGYDMLDMN